MPFKNKEQKSEYSRNHYQETKLKKEKNKRYQQTHRDKKKMERDQENRDQLAELPTTNNVALSHTSAPTRKHPPVTPLRETPQTPTPQLRLSKAIFEKVVNTP